MEIPNLVGSKMCESLVILEIAAQFFLLCHCVIALTPSSLFVSRQSFRKPLKLTVVNHTSRLVAFSNYFALEILGNMLHYIKSMGLLCSQNVSISFCDPDGLVVKGSAIATFA